MKFCERDFEDIFNNDSLSNREKFQKARKKAGIGKSDSVYLNHDNSATVNNARYEKGEDGNFYRMNAIKKTRPGFKKVFVGRDYENEKDDDDKFIKVPTDETYYDYEPTDEKMPDLVQQYLDATSKYDRSRDKEAENKSNVESRNAVSKLKSLLTFTQEAEDFKDFDDPADAEDDYTDEVYGVMSIHLKDKVIGYVRYCGEFDFSYNSETTYYSAATYWDPEESAGNFTVEYKDGEYHELMYYTPDKATEAQDGELCCLSFEDFCKSVEPKLIANLLEKAGESFITSQIDDLANFEKSYSGEW